MSRRNSVLTPCKLVANPTILQLELECGIFWIIDCTPVSIVIAVTVSLDGWGRTVTWTGTIVCRVPARMPGRALTSSMASPASVAKASEVSVWHDTHNTR